MPTERELSVIAAELRLAAKALSRNSSLTAEMARDLDYWRGLNPGLTVGEEPSTTAPERSLSAEEKSRIARRFEHDGYYSVANLIAPDFVAKMRSGVEAVMQAGWPPVFSFVYDQFWNIVRGREMIALLSSFLGEGVRQNGKVWTYYVYPIAGAGGWPPHTDNSVAGGRLTAWIALSDATLDNGCMYVLPASALPEGVGARFGAATGLSFQDVGVLLQAAKALPAAAGSVMGWKHDVIHWGSKTHDAEAPRISIALEFLADGTPPQQAELPLQELASLPPFAERLYLIGRAIQDYARFEVRMVQFEGLARLLTTGYRQSVSG